MNLFYHYSHHHDYHYYYHHYCSYNNYYTNYYCYFYHYNYLYNDNSNNDNLINNHDNNIHYNDNDNDVIIIYIAIISMKIIGMMTKSFQFFLIISHIFVKSTEFSIFPPKNAINLSIKVDGC